MNETCTVLDEGDLGEGDRIHVLLIEAIEYYTMAMRGDYGSWTL